jgi:hypothetical protein
VSTLPPPDNTGLPPAPLPPSPPEPAPIPVSATLLPPSAATPILAGGTAATTTTLPPVRARGMQILWLVLAVLVVAGILRLFSHHENTYEKIAHQLTAAVQSNSMPAVQKMENAETAAEMTRARLGQAADTLAPLGEIKRVHETSATGDAPRVHEFDVTFEKGVAHEKIQFDPDDKVFHFRYDVLPPK